MKIKIVFLLSWLFFFLACKKQATNDTIEEVEQMELMTHLNGTWQLESVTDGSINPTMSDNPLISDEVIWEINGTTLDIILLIDETFANLSEGKHTIKIIEETRQGDLQFLLVDEEAIGAIVVTEGRLSINTRNKPNEAISHAPTYIFAKKE